PRPPQTPPPPLARLLPEGLAGLDSGDLARAESAFRKALGIAPAHPDALHFLGLVAHHAGHPRDAIELMTRSLRINAKNPYCQNNLGEAFRALGRWDDAADCYHRALSLNPSFPEAHNNLAAVHLARGDSAAAIAASRTALALRADFAEAANNLGNALCKAERYREGIESYRRALELRPEFPEALNNLGNALHAERQLEEAIKAYRAALALWPDFAEAWSNLGAARRDGGQDEEAIAACQKALSIQPDHRDAMLNLGRLYTERGWLDDAETCFRQGLRNHPECTEALQELSAVLNRKGRLDESLSCCQEALRRSPDAAAHNHLGNALRAIGRVEEALSAYRQALALAPDDHHIHSNMLHVMPSSAAVSLQEILEAHRAYASRFETPHRAGWSPPPAPGQSGRRLRIGYVSADFRDHAVTYFMLPILASHDKRSFEIRCYYNGRDEDDHTRLCKSLVDHWTPCAHLSDEALDVRIRQDGIDILVDLSGHTAGNRLPVFARKPAPLQVTYLGYATTTGLTAVDYRLTHELADPAGSEGYYSEALYRLPGALWCYRPKAGMPDVTPLPADRNGYLTLGSMNSLTKISPAAMALWADVLHALPEARLLLVTVPEGSARESLQRQFAAKGIDPARLILRGRQSPEAFWATHAEIDIALDPFPYNGGTTTCETLWLGVPVVALAGEGFVSRLGHTLLTLAGLPELVAHDPAEYVRIIASLDADRKRLGQLRADLRARLANSPLRDEPQFTRQLEAAYRAMWTARCAG
ncbi:MAG: tetratricopeptide repeat protein, partial [Proteobacteria bacterium]|nr:tetratricopeptide repeat protein [Pseudomonadota bacterium]